GRLPDELEPGGALDQRPQARLELDPGEGSADADVDAAAEADVVGCVRAADVEDVGVGEDTRVAVRGAEQHRDHLTSRPGDPSDLDAVHEHPALAELEWGVEADQLCHGRGG